MLTAARSAMLIARAAWRMAGLPPGLDAISSSRSIIAAAARPASAGAAAGRPPWNALP